MKIARPQLLAEQGRTASQPLGMGSRAHSSQFLPRCQLQEEGTHGQAHIRANMRLPWNARSLYIEVERSHRYHGRMNKTSAQQISGTVTATIRVRYAETDQMQMAYYGRYFEWFEVARSEYCRVRGIDYAAMEAAGLFMPIMEARCRYKAPAHYDD